MRLTSVLVGISTALILALSGQVYAGCDDLVEDSTKIANRKIDVAKVTAEARALAGRSATVRVRVYDTLQGKSDIEVFGDKIAKECGWLHRDGTYLSNLIFIPFAVEKGDIDVVRGGAIGGRITSAVVAKAKEAYMIPRWQTYKHDPTALTSGLVDMLHAFNVVLAQPLVSSGGGGGNTTIIHEAPKQSADLSWLRWLVIIGGGVLALVVAVFLFLRVNQDRGEGQSAQGQAKIARQKCLRRLLVIRDSSAIATMEAMIDATKSRLPKGKAAEVQQLLSTFKKQGETATAEFERFDGVDKDDPNVNGLSPSAYRSNEQAYEDILAGSIEPAEESSRKISELLNSATSAKVA